jgi:hypothetical protein
MPSYTYSTSFAITASQRPSSPIEDPSLLLIFWEQLNECLGTHLIKSSAYHPQTDGQMELVNQIIEDILRACVLTDGLK